MLHNTRFGVSKKTIVIASSIVVIILGGVIAGILIHQRNLDQNAKNDTSKSGENPQFATALPNGKSISSLGGWNRISPPEKDPVFAYEDKIGNVSITVSEQPLPASFKNDIDTQVTELAKSFNATTPIAAGNVKAYLGTSAKGPQSVIFAKNNLLILIKSQQKVDDKDWAKYIESLN
jgi:hypothetical protein